MDEYQRSPTGPEPAEPPPEAAAVPYASSGRHYATFEESIADLKNHDKDCSYTPDALLAELDSFIQKFQKEFEWYSDPFCTVVFPDISPVQFDYLRKRFGTISTAIHDLLQQMKRSIRDYMTRHPDLWECAMKVDDGFTGSNFDRPAFQEMMAEVKAGKINCIVVKDLSRFGRNHLEAGEYLERIFPFLGVRFIAINDNYDSMNSNSESDELIVPFKKSTPFFPPPCWNRKQPPPFMWRGMCASLRRTAASLT